ncbi:MAG: adenylate/guanylate cyclase domain-containing protein [Hyphomicrobiales bacterium]|nr:adenylate/guanylate cyclase domain-containing protein [Hyphomicrobiales bacterium]
MDFWSIPVSCRRGSKRIQIQLAMSGREAKVPDDSRTNYRFGINPADIVIDGDDILGDWVNAAASLDSMAPTSGICISDLVWQNLRGELGENFSLCGEANLKNISRKVNVWQWPADETYKAPATFAENIDLNSSSVLNNCSSPTAC